MKDISYPLQSRYYTKAHTQTCVDKRNKATNMIRNSFFFRYLSTLSLQLHCCVYMDKNAEVSAARAHLYSDQMPQTHTWKASPHDTHDMSSLRWMPRPFVHSRFVWIAHTHTHSTRSQWDKGTRERVRERVRNNEKFTLNGAIVCFFAYDSMSAHGYLSSPPQTYICLSIYNKMVFMKSSFYPHRFCLWPLCRYCSRCLHSSTAFESFCSGYLIPSEEHLCVHWMSEQHGCYLFVK